MSMIAKSGFRFANSIPEAVLIPAVDTNGHSSNVQQELNQLYGALAIQNYNIAANHNGIYRGAVLVDTVGETGRYDIDELFALVSQGDFSDIYIGDIIKVNQAAVTYTPAGGSATTDPAQNVEWIVMGIDTYLGAGNTELTNHHLVLVPKNAFTTPAHMNRTNSTEGGYAGSDMFTNILPAYETAVSNSLGGHILTYMGIVSNEMNTTAASSGYSGQTGCSSGWTWASITLNLLNEVEVFGTAAWGNVYDIGERNSQLPGFALNPKLKIKGRGADGRSGWWTSAIVSSIRFSAVARDMNASNGAASNASGIVPKVLFG